MEKITSLQNALVKKVVSLRYAKVRRLENLTIIDGAREIKRALDVGIILEKVFFLKNQQEILLKQLSMAKVELIEVSSDVMEKLAYGDRHEGILAVAVTPRCYLKDLELSAKPLIVVLEALEKPGNLGAILRTCDGVGVEAVLVCDAKTDVFNPNVIRSSTGMVFTLPVVCASSQEILDFLKAQKIKVYAASPSAKRNYSDENLNQALGIILGAEDKGLSDFWLKHADKTMKIPMQGKADSLNVSTSAAIILYEALRQRI